MSEPNAIAAAIEGLIEARIVEAAHPSMENRGLRLFKRDHLDEALRILSWECGCGTLNGINLATCRCCLRPCAEGMMR